MSSKKEAQWCDAGSRRAGGLAQFRQKEQTVSTWAWGQTAGRRVRRIRWLWLQISGTAVNPKRSSQRNLELHFQSWELLKSWSLHQWGLNMCHLYLLGWSKVKIQLLFFFLWSLLSVKNVLFFLPLQLNIWASLCRVWHDKAVFTFIAECAVSLRSLKMTRICDITNDSEVDQYIQYREYIQKSIYIIFRIHNCEVETWRLQFTLRMDFSVTQETSCVQQLNFWNEKIKIRAI